MRKTKRAWHRSIAAASALALLLCACGVPEAVETEETPAETIPAISEPAETSAPAQTPEPSETPEPTETPEPVETVAETEPAVSQAQEILDGMTLQQKVSQLFFVTPEQLTGESATTSVGDAMRSALQTYPVCGIILLGQNLTSRDQVISLTADLQSAAPYGLFLSLDEEGGRVTRVSKKDGMGVTYFPAMGEIGATGDVEKAREVGTTLGTQLQELGFNVDFAPVADVFSNPDNTVIGDRSFGSDPQLVAEMVTAEVQGFNSTGMMCTLKHFPGHGDTAEDSHYGSAVSYRTLEELEETELVPFRAGVEAGADFVMVGHISVPEVTGSSVPATLSPELISILKEDIGFDGLIITDAMSMEAITDYYSSGEAAVLALQAGVDIILAPASLSSAVDGVLEAVENGTLTEERIDESVLKILNLKLDHGIIE